MSAPAAPVRIVVADDHQIVRSGFTGLLGTQPDFTVVGTAEDGAEAVRVCRQTCPDVVLMDVRMPGVDGIEATRQLIGAAGDGPAGDGPAGDGPAGDGPRIVILTTFDLDEYAFGALRLGASGFILKDVQPSEFVRAIRSVADGDAVIAPSVTRRLLNAFAHQIPDPQRADRADHPGLGQLTAREREILTELAGGYSNAEIAERLFVAEATVKTHLGRVLAKLGLRDRVQAVVYAYEAGLVERRTS
jgi:DNA-binding NarL/FixJ family response regulator